MESCSAWCCSLEKGVGDVTPVRGTMALLSSLYRMKEENHSQAWRACAAHSAQMLLCSGPFKTICDGGRWPLSWPLSWDTCPGGQLCIVESGGSF